MKWSTRFLCIPLLPAPSWFWFKQFEVTFCHFWSLTQWPIEHPRWRT
jgi:hypothetical protein